MWPDADRTQLARQDAAATAAFQERAAHTALVSFVMLCVTLAFFPVTEPADLTSNALNTARLIELGLLGLAAGAVTLAVLYRRCAPALPGTAPLLVFAFATWAALSAIWSANPILSFARGGTLMLIFYIAAALAIYVRDVSPQPVRTASAAMAYALLGSVAVLFLSNIALWGTMFPFTEDSSWTGRPGRLYFAWSVPLETGELIGLAIVACAFGIRSLPARYALLLALGLLLYLTDARNVILFVPLALAVALFQRGSLPVRFLLAAAAVCAGSMLLVLVASGVLSAYMPSDIGTLNGRIPLWGMAGEHVVENPFLGVGYYATRFYLLDADFPAGHTHNAYIETVMGLGLVGLFLLASFLVHTVRIGAVDKTGLVTSILALCVLGSMFNPLLMVSNAHTFYLFVALLVAEAGAAARRTGPAETAARARTGDAACV